MDEVVRIIEHLRSVSSTNEKLSILEKNKDNSLLKKILFYTYNPYFKYGITEQVFTNYKQHPYPQKDYFDLLDKLIHANITDTLRSKVVRCVNDQPQPHKDIVKSVFLKDLKIKLNAKSINKVWKNLIPEFNVQLAESLASQKDDFLDGKEFSITTKLDGNRMIYLPNEQKFYTRQGKLYEGIDHLLEECKVLSSGMYVLDGELLCKNEINLSSDELYRLTTSICRKKGETKEKKKLEFHVFDIIPLSEFMNGESEKPYETRMKILDSQFKSRDFKLIKRVPILYKGYDISVINQLLDQITSEGGEGLMLNLSDGTYQCKRTKNILKIKKFKDADVLVKDIYEGTKENKGTLGGLIVKVLIDNEEVLINVGSGFTKEERDLFFNHPDVVVGKVIEIHYFEVSKNKRGECDLRFATYTHRIRNDKTENDITNIQIEKK